MASLRTPPHLHPFTPFTPSSWSCQPSVSRAWCTSALQHSTTHRQSRLLACGRLLAAAGHPDGNVKGRTVPLWELVPLSSTSISECLDIFRCNLQSHRRTPDHPDSPIANAGNALKSFEVALKSFEVALNGPQGPRASCCATAAPRTSGRRASARSSLSSAIIR